MRFGHGPSISGIDASDMLRAPLEDLPPVEFAFAYGSGVFEQPGNLHLTGNEPPMVDYILGVKAPICWHSENLERNRHHYNSLLAYFGGKGVSLVADKIGCGVHFNAFVPWNGKMIKYGVISMECLLQDILSWKSLYISGRLQKPVKILVDDWGIAKVNRVNLQAAAAAALLLLPAEFSEVKRIVQGNAGRFRSLYYSPLCHIAASGLLHIPSSFGNLGSMLKRDCNQHAADFLVSSLPDTVLGKMLSSNNRVATNTRGMGENSVLVQGGDPVKGLQRALQSIVRVSSMKQIASGILAAGGVNSMRYAWKKATKSWHSRY